MKVRTKSPREVINSLDTYRECANLIIAGLTHGPAFAIGETKRQSLTTHAAHMHLTIVTLTGAKRFGYRPKANIKPIGTGYFGAPLQRDADLYVLECQFVPVAEAQARANPIERAEFPHGEFPNGRELQGDVYADGSPIEPIGKNWIGE